MSKSIVLPLFCIVLCALLAACDNAAPEASSRSSDAGGAALDAASDAAPDASPRPLDAGSEDATSAPEVGDEDTGERDSSAPSSPSVSPSFAAIFSDPDDDHLVVLHRSEEGERLFELGEDGSWSQIRLPEPLRDDPQVRISSVVFTSDAVLMATHGSGAWQRDLEGEEWTRFEAHWLDPEGHVGRLRKHQDQVFAYHYTRGADESPVVELWERREVDWRFVQRDLPMIIDYMPTDEMLLRTTSYTTVEISHDDGQSWQTVPGLISNTPPQLFEWKDDVAALTTNGVWLTRDSGRTWQKLSEQGGRAATLVGDELVVINSNTSVSAVTLPGGEVRALPRLPSGTYFSPELARSQDALYLTGGGPDLLRLAEGASDWESIPTLR